MLSVDALVSCIARSAAAVILHIWNSGAPYRLRRRISFTFAISVLSGGRLYKYNFRFPDINSARQMFNFSW